MSRGLCACGREITGRQRTRCTWCAKNDPHRHNTRKKGQIIVSVDCEGKQTAKGMFLVSVSYGREDGTSNSYSKEFVTGQQAIGWLIKELADPYTAPDGTVYNQIPVSFHFTWDSSVIAKDFKKDLMLVHKATARTRGLLCATADCDETCGKLHRYDQDTCQDVISDGGEGDLIAWDRHSKIGLALSAKRRLYAEYRPHGDRMEERKVLDIHDTGSAFVGGLEDVIDKWKPELSGDQRKVIAWGKQARKSGFFDAPIEQIEAYSEAECVAHARCVRMLLDAIKDAAKIVMPPNTLFGSGSVASRAFKHYGVLTRTETHEETKVVSGMSIDDIARMTYFGGLIETPVLGLVQGLVDEVDLNSAYPAQMIHLPCMKAGHGMWHRERGKSWKQQPPTGTVGHVLATWDVETISTPPFIVRTPEGTVKQPLSGYRIWVSLAEFQAAREQFGPNVISHEAVWWIQDCPCENPLAWLQELYDARLEIKNKMALVDKGSDEWQGLKVREEAIKLIINSCYGKLAQQRPDLGKYTNLHYASHITGATRALVRKETWLRETQGGTVVYTHTDSVLSQGGNPQDGGMELGKWKLEKQSIDLLVVQPGLAVALGGGKTASRGCRKGEFSKAAATWAETTDLTQHPTQWPKLEIDREMMISRRMAVARGKPEIAGSFVKMPLKVSFNSTKRDVQHAVPMEGCDTAWIVPPIRSVGEAANLNDLKQYQTRLAKRIKDGEFDKEPGRPTYDELDS